MPQATSRANSSQTPANNRERGPLCLSLRATRMKGELAMSLALVAIIGLA